MSPFVRKFLTVISAVLLFASCSKDDPVIPQPASTHNAGDFAGVIGSPRIFKQSEIVDYAFKTISSFAGIPSSQASMVRTFLYSLITCDVVVTKVEYYTSSPASSEPVKASGVLAWPVNAQTSGRFDEIISVSHATCDIDAAPSLQDFPPELAPVFSSVKTPVVCLADYLGYGSSRTSDLQHPYVNTKYTGSACADLIQAAQQYLREKTNLRNYQPKFHLCGYSQGGHGAIATMLELQRRGLSDRISRVDAGAGPLDVNCLMQKFTSGVMSGMMGLVPYTIRGAIYANNLKVDLNNIYAPKTVALADMFSTKMLSQWHSALGRSIGNILHEDFFKTDRSQMNEDVLSVLDALMSDSALNFSVQDPEKITLYHEKNDELVPCECSLNAQKKWQVGKFVELEISDHDHAIGAVEFYIRLLDDNSGRVWSYVYDLLQPFLSSL